MLSVVFLVELPLIIDWKWQLKHWSAMNTGILSG